MPYRGGIVQHQLAPLLLVGRSTQRAQYGFIKEYVLNHIRDSQA